MFKRKYVNNERLRSCITQYFIQTGYSVRIVAPLTISDFTFDWHDGRTINKIVHYFLLERIDALEAVANREDNEDFENTWLTAKEAYSALSFDDMKAALKKAIDIIESTEKQPFV